MLADGGRHDAQLKLLHGARALQATPLETRAIRKPRWSVEASRRLCMYEMFAIVRQFLTLMVPYCGPLSLFVLMFADNWSTKWFDLR